MQEFKVTVSNIFEAESAEDAVTQMVAWLDDNCYHAGYRVSISMPGVTDSGVLIDADNIDFTKEFFS
jgi:hypothetical protein